MKVLYSWLKEYVDVNLSPRDLAGRLTMAGLEVTNVQSLGGEDSILDLDLTTNRGDCLCMVGIAREVSTLVSRPLRLPDIWLPTRHEPEPKAMAGGQETNGDINDLVTVNIEESDGCLRYSARVVRNVKIGPSPEWLKARLRASDVRPINNVVDVTNYCMLELGQPLHAFDYEALEGRSILVRNAKAGESITTIDGVTRLLKEDTLVIADRKKPIAIAGIIGGLASEVRPSTRCVLIESAHFDPIRIRRSSQELGLHTPSSHRFEREPDPAGTIMALNRCIQLIKSLFEGEVVRGVIDICAVPFEPIRLSFDPRKVNRILGTRLSAKQIGEFLTRLGFGVGLKAKPRKIPKGDERGKVEVRVPTFRRDIARQIDLIEEIARVYGYSQIPTTIPLVRVAPAQRNLDQSISERAKEILIGCGLNEVINYSFISSYDLDRINLSKNSRLRQVVKLRNPIREGQDMMRTTLIPGLLRVLAHNLNRGNLSVKIFELGKVFLSKGSHILPHERKVLGGLILGPRGEGFWAKLGDVDLYDLKGIVEELLEGLAVPSWQILPVLCSFLLPGSAARILAGSTRLGVLGKVHPGVASSYGIDRSAYIFELDFDRLAKLASSKRTYHSLDRYPSVSRDISFLCSVDVSSRQIGDLISRVGGGLVKEATIFDVYRGEGIPEGKRSLAYSVTYRSEDGTLTNREVSVLHEKICQRLVEDLGAEIRR